MIKDSKGRFKDNDLWGEGWGWALFKREYALSFQPCVRQCTLNAIASSRDTTGPPQLSYVAVVISTQRRIHNTIKDLLKTIRWQGKTE